jgi:ribosomal protein L7/L12
MTIVVAGFDIDPPSSYRRFVGLLDDEPTTQPAPTKAELAEEERQLYAEALKKQLEDAGAKVEVK